ncbi:MAG: hypothetical protein ACRDPI_00070 [Nocardioidaceae bacterium]
MNQRLMPNWARSSRASVGVAALASIAALAVSGAASPARSTPSTDCPTAYPESSLTANQPVTGLTVSQGTTPDPFSGEVLGVLQDGIAPGLDMILVRLTSPEIDRVGGIWEGMSGSPVYASDGSLIGAVSYGLATGPSTVAGVTPAADMQALLTEQDTAAPATKFATRATLTKALTSRLVASGAASSSEAAGGMRRLRLPFSISGMATDKRRADLAKGLHLTNAHLMAGGAPGSSTPSYPMVTGGNIAATISYGDVTAAGIGTVTAICGTQVLGFGHPMEFLGSSSYFLQGADAIYVQEDPTVAGFKVANLGAPVGTVTGDHLAGILGVTGASPSYATVTSSVAVDNRSRTGSSYIAIPDDVPDIATANMISDQDRVLDYTGKGSGTASWTIKGTRHNGTAFSVSRSDVYSDDYDISYATGGDLSNALYEIYYNGHEPVTIDSVTTSSHLDQSTGSYTIKRVQAFERGAWRTLNGNSVVTARAGSTKKFHVRLTSGTFSTRNITVSVHIPATARGKSGSVEVYGGNASASDGGLYGDDGSSSSTLNQVLSQLRSAPHHNQVVADLQMYSRSGNPAAHRQGRFSLAHVVNGDLMVSIDVH